MEQICCCAAAQELKPIMLMILNQIASGGVNLFYKLAVADGMKFLKPFRPLNQICVCRKSRPRFSKMIALQAFVGEVRNTKIGRKSEGLVSALSIAGAMVLSFYEGINVTLWSTHVDLLRLLVISGSSRVLCWARYWPYPATKMSYNNPCYSSTVLTCFSGAILAGVYALCTEWQLGWNIRLVASAYMGVIGSGLVIAVTVWGSRVKGPLYVISFLPVALILVAIIGSIALGEKLTLGSELGSVTIITGLCFVMWGKWKETKMTRSYSITAREDTSENASSAAAVQEV
ncbi:WAT1-related protein At1g68170-like [Primulina tabacum]|uniref:WAT1-related protein At1g68170-like n=1 Tax=Primulina tabacum TaxID=48773 RepID=UPI003F590600